MPGIVRMHTLTCITTSHIFLRRRAESFRPIEKILYKNIKSKMIHIGLRIKITRLLVMIIEQKFVASLISLL